MYDARAAVGLQSTAPMANNDAVVDGAVKVLTISRGRSKLISLSQFFLLGIIRERERERESESI
jgi:hypothetical protein